MVSVRFVFEVQVSGPGAEVVLQLVKDILTTFIGGGFLVWAARVQASHQHPPELPPPSPPRHGRRGRRPGGKGRSP